MDMLTVKQMLMTAATGEIPVIGGEGITLEMLRPWFLDQAEEFYDLYLIGMVTFLWRDDRLVVTFLPKAMEYFDGTYPVEE